MRWKPSTLATLAISLIAILPAFIPTATADDTNDWCIPDPLSVHDGPTEICFRTTLTPTGQEVAPVQNPGEGDVLFTTYQATLTIEVGSTTHTQDWFAIEAGSEPPDCLTPNPIASPQPFTCEIGAKIDDFGAPGPGDEDLFKLCVYDALIEIEREGPWPLTGSNVIPVNGIALRDCED